MKHVVCALTLVLGTSMVFAQGPTEWNLGQMYRGQDYNLTFPVFNNCRIGQTVTITYPPEIPMKGPESVDVPAYGHVDVPIRVFFKPLPPPPDPLPVGGDDPRCMLPKGMLKMVHLEVTQSVKVFGGTSTFTCHGAEKNYPVTAHVHMYPPPGEGGGGGGGGKKKKNACQIYFETGEFRPDKEFVTPEMCKVQLEDLAFAMLTEQIPPIQETMHDPGMFAWLPKGMDASKLLAERQTKSDPNKQYDPGPFVWLPKGVDPAKLLAKRAAADTPAEKPDPNKQYDPGPFVWLPKGVDPATLLKQQADLKQALGKLTPDELMKLRAQADTVVREAKKQ